MVYDPIKKREYDRIRNARLKAEYLEKNPDYKPTRKSKYVIQNDNKYGLPTTQSWIGGDFNNIYSKPKQNVKYNNELEKDTKKKISLNLDDDNDIDIDYEDDNFLFIPKNKTKYVKHAIKFI